MDASSSSTTKKTSLEFINHHLKLITKTLNEGHKAAAESAVNFVRQPVDSLLSSTMIELDTAVKSEYQSSQNTHSEYMDELLQDIQGSAHLSIRDTKKAMKSIVAFAENFSGSISRGNVNDANVIAAVGDMASDVTIAVDTLVNMPTRTLGSIISTSIKAFTAATANNTTKEKQQIIIVIMEAAIAAIQASVEHESTLHVAAEAFKDRLNGNKNTGPVPPPDARNISDMSSQENVDEVVKQTIAMYMSDDVVTQAISWAWVMTDHVQSVYPCNGVLGNFAGDTLEAVFKLREAYKKTGDEHLKANESDSQTSQKKETLINKERLLLARFKQNGAPTKKQLDLDTVNGHLKNVNESLKKGDNAAAKRAVDSVRVAISESTRAGHLIVGSAITRLQNAVECDSQTSTNKISEYIVQLLKDIEGSTSSSIDDTETAMQSMVTLTEKFCIGIVNEGATAPDIIAAIGDTASAITNAVASLTNFPARTLGLMTSTSMKAFKTAIDSNSTDTKTQLIMTIMEAAVVAIQAVIEHDSTLEVAAAAFNARLNANEKTDAVLPISDYVSLKVHVDQVVEELAAMYESNGPGKQAISWLMQLSKLVVSIYGSNAVFEHVAREALKAVTTLSDKYETSRVKSE